MTTLMTVLEVLVFALQHIGRRLFEILRIVAFSFAITCCIAFALWFLRTFTAPWAS